MNRGKKETRLVNEASVLGHNEREAEAMAEARNWQKLERLWHVSAVDLSRND